MRNHKGILAEVQHSTALACAWLLVQGSIEGDHTSEAVNWLPLIKLNHRNDSMSCELRDKGHWRSRYMDRGFS